MASFSFWATLGLCLLKLCLAETEFNVTCRYGGVFHVEKNGRYSLTRTEAVELCRALNSTLATLEQVKKANELGFETCRYGFVVGHVVIPRVKPYHLCAANHTGVYKLAANTTGRYDVYCYNQTETRNKSCDPIERLDASFLSNQDEIVIDNADGSRYNADGTRHSGEFFTSGAGDDNVGSGATHDTTPMDASIRRSSSSYYGSATPASQLPDHSSGGGDKEAPTRDSDDEVSPVSSVFPLVTATDESPSRAGGSYPASTTDLTSSGNGSDDEDSSEEATFPTVFPGWDGTMAKDKHAPSTTPGPHRDDLEEATTQAWWNPFSNHWWWSNPGEKTQGPTQATKADLTSSGNGSDDEDSSEEATFPTVFPGWDGTMAKDKHAPSTITAVASADGAHHEDPTQPPLPSDSEPGQGTEGIVHPTAIPGNEALHTTTSSRGKAGAEPPLTASDPMGDANQEEATKGPLSAGTLPGGESQGANSTEGSHAGWMPGLFPDAEDHLNQLQTSPPTITAVASADGAHHEDPTQPPLPSDSEPGQGTEGIVHPTAIPGNEVIHTTTSSRGKAGAEPPLTGTSSDPMGDANQEEATKGPLSAGTLPGGESQGANSTEGSHAGWMPGLFPDAEDHLNQLQTSPPTITAVASADGAHHEDPTQPPLPSDSEPGQGTEGIVHPTAIPGNEALHTTTSSWGKAGAEPPLTASDPMGDANQEEATKGPLSAGTLPGGESQGANSTEGSHAGWMPGLFPDAEDHLNQLQTSFPTRSTSSIYGNQGPHRGYYESTTSPGETATTKIVPQARSAKVPEWLIVVAALLALALILAVCIAVNSRRRCGQKKKLVINNGKGAVEDRKTSGLNGDASKSQEMVHLVHKEQSNDQTGACDEFLTVNETQNHQELDMKSGV
ncbi:CD44 antigen isoform X3 [Pogoniulus pusillus]|uniref:CD44 antigen isoform X3 n=1 Tax=Pogoniulus pusillus TaxID=488313 RepID=UPI0030B99126